MIVVASIAPVATYLQAQINVADLVALLVALIPTTIGALLSAIGIAAIDRTMRFNVLAMSGKAVEAAGDVQTLILDKTGTITTGNREANDFIAVHGFQQRDLIQAAFLHPISIRRRRVDPSSRAVRREALNRCWCSTRRRDWIFQRRPA